MDNSKLKSFIEQSYCAKYQPQHIVPNLAKNTSTKKFFLYRPFASGFLETEFYFDTILNAFMRNVAADWDPLYEDTFS